MIVANRLLKLRLAEGQVEIPILIYAPQRDNSQWFCSYEIGWPDGKRKSAAAGFDSAQSLLLAFEKIGTEIYASDYHKSGNLMWDEPGRGFGFPVPPNLRNMLVGDDAKYL
ncbi:MAG TPA: hypothetical protein VGH13_08720 [Xanthobacteraceae bacterium]|jgi:hypothetical protein